MQTITLAGGCFWCTEAVFRRLKGVLSVTPGYSGGTAEDPSYEQVSTGTTGHAEAVQVEFDPSIISLETLLDVFWAVHDPTALNRQGADIGPQYRSAIFYGSEEQRAAAQKSKVHLEASKKYSAPIVTEITPFKNFYPAEDYHHDYYEHNRENGYCKLVIDPKIHKLYSDFEDTLKPQT